VAATARVSSPNAADEASATAGECREPQAPETRHRLDNLSNATTELRR
jgi:hypothetical protein